MSSSASQEREAAVVLPWVERKPAQPRKGSRETPGTISLGASLIQGKGRGPAGSVHGCCSRPRASANPQQLPDELTRMPGIPVISQEIIANRPHYIGHPFTHACMNSFTQSVSRQSFIGSLLLCAEDTGPLGTFSLKGSH